jgi:hypothetical protein
MAPPIPGAPPLAPGVPGAPPVPGGSAAPVDPLTALGLVQKDAVKPHVRMRALHWKTLNAKQLAGTVWAEWGRAAGSGEGATFDAAALEGKFGTDVDVAKAKKADEKVPKWRSKMPKTASLLDSKMSNNVNICLSRFKTTLEAVRDAVLACDDSVLTDERLPTLIKCAPKPEDLKAVLSYEGNEPLGNAEKFFLLVSEIPDYKLRLELFSFRRQYTAICDEIDAHITAFEAAVDGITDSDGLKTVMQLVLAMGNYLNGGTNRGCAHGFSLSTLTSLKMTRANAPAVAGQKFTLMHFLVETLTTSHPTALAFADDLQYVALAARLDFASVGGDVRIVERSLEKLQQQLVRFDGADGDALALTDRFGAHMRPFYDAHKDVPRDMRARLDGVTEKIAHLVELYGEKPGTKPEFVLGVFSTFLLDFEGAVASLKKMSDTAAKKAARDAKTAETARLRAEAEARGETFAAPVGGDKKGGGDGGGGSGKKKRRWSIKNVAANTSGSFGDGGFKTQLKATKQGAAMREAAAKAQTTANSNDGDGDEAAPLPPPRRAGNVQRRRRSILRAATATGDDDGGHFGGIAFTGPVFDADNRDDDDDAAAKGRRRAAKLRTPAPPLPPANYRGRGRRGSYDYSDDAGGFGGAKAAGNVSANENQTAAERFAYIMSMAGGDDDDDSDFEHDSDHGGYTDSDYESSESDGSDDNGTAPPPPPPPKMNMSSDSLAALSLKLQNRRRRRSSIRVGSISFGYGRS